MSEKMSVYVVDDNNEGCNRIKDELRKNDRFEEDRCAIEKKHALRLQGSQRGWIKYRQSDNDP